MQIRQLIVCKKDGHFLLFLLLISRRAEGEFGKMKKQKGEKGRAWNLFNSRLKTLMNWEMGALREVAEDGGGLLFEA